MNWRDKQSESDADADIESTDGNSPDVENSPPSPSETNSDNSTRGRGRSRGRCRGRGHGSCGRRQGNQRCHEATSTSAEEGRSEGSSVQFQPFSMNVGPTFPLEEPVAIFSALFTPQLLDHIVAETNRNATLCLTSTHKGESPPPTWEKMPMKPLHIWALPYLWESTEYLTCMTTGPHVSCLYGACKVLPR